MPPYSSRGRRFAACCADRLLANKQKRGKKLVGSQVIGVDEVLLASRAAGTGT